LATRARQSPPAAAAAAAAAAPAAAAAAAQDRVTGQKRDSVCQGVLQAMHGRCLTRVTVCCGHDKVAAGQLTLNAAATASSLTRAMINPVAGNSVAGYLQITAIFCMPLWLCGARTA
jgi:hypothetical protein